MTTTTLSRSVSPECGLGAWSASINRAQGSYELERSTNDWSSQIPDPGLSSQDSVHPSTSVNDSLAHNEGAFTLVAPPASPTAQSAPLSAASTSVDLYSNPKIVPGTKGMMKLYANAPIALVFQQRFRVLVGLFKGAVDNDSTLKLRTQDVNYDLRICGRCPADALPTILVFCTKDIFGRLRSLLERDSIRCQYGRRKEGRLPPILKRLQGQTPPAASTLTFRLVFWCENSIPTKRKSAQEPVDAHIHSRMTMCGSLIRFSHSTSTLGLLVSVDSKIYGLTVDHIRGIRKIADQHIADDVKWRTDIKEILVEDIIKDTEAIEEGPGSSVTEDLWVDDLEYDVSDAEESASNDSDFSIVYQASEESRHPPAVTETQQPWEAVGSLVHVARDVSPRRPYLDWTLVDLFGEQEYASRPNALHIQGNSKKPRLLAAAATGAETFHTPVMMISGASGIRRGTLLPGVSYIGGQPGEELCEVLVVDLSDSLGIVRGDCGSIVVHEQTLKVYGHVVASNPLEQAYIVPLRNTLKQIAEDFEAHEASLPDPFFSLATLVSESTRLNTRDGEVTEFLKATVEDCNIDILPAFWTAASRGLTHVMKAMLQALDGAGLQRLPERAHDKTPLEVAAHFGQEEMVQLLLEWGATPTNLAVRLAAEEGHLDTLRLLLAKMVDLDDAQDTNALLRISYFARTLETGGKYTEAEQLLQRVMAKAKKGLGLEHPTTLDAFNNLAHVQEKLGQYDKAEAIHRRVVQLREKSLGKTNPDTLTSLNNLAQVVQKRGNYEEAEKISRQVLDQRTIVLGNRHRDTLISLSNLAEVLEKRGKYSESEEMNRRALTRREDALGSEHPDTLTSLNNLAQVLRSCNKLSEAEQIARRAVEGFQKVFGKDHPFTFTCMSNLAQILKSNGQLSEAEDMYRSVLAGRRNAIGWEHPSTLTTLSSLSQLLERQGKYEEAAEHSRIALKGFTKQLGPEHPFTLTSVYCIAHLLHQQRKYDDAAPYYKRASDGYKKVLGVSHPTTVECLDNESSCQEQRRERNRRLLDESGGSSTARSSQQPQKRNNRSLVFAEVAAIPPRPLLPDPAYDLVSERSFSFIGSPYGNAM